MDMNGVNLVSLIDENPASSNAFRQVSFEKKCVKPTEKAKKLGTSRRCSTIMTCPFVLHNLRHSFKKGLSPFVSEFHVMRRARTKYLPSYL